MIGVGLSLVLLAGVAPLRPAAAQFDVPTVARNLLTQVILQLQTGTPNPMLYGTELWQTIAVQTGGSGVYVPLLQLGPVNHVAINQQLPLPTGALFSMTAQHQNGTSSWTLGFSTVTGRIEYLNFNVGGAAPTLPPTVPATRPLTQPVVPDPGGGLPQPRPPPNPQPETQPKDSPACRKYPTLC